MDTSRSRTEQIQTDLVKLVRYTKYFIHEPIKDYCPPAPAPTIEYTYVRVSSFKKVVKDNNNKVFFVLNGFYPESDYSCTIESVTIPYFLIEKRTIVRTVECFWCYGQPHAKFKQTEIEEWYNTSAATFRGDFLYAPEMASKVHSFADLKAKAVGDVEEKWTANSEGLTEVIRERAIASRNINKFNNSFGLRDKGTEEDARNTALRSGDSIVHPLDYFFFIRPTVEWINCVVGEARFLANQNVRDLMLQQNPVRITKFNHKKISRAQIVKYHGTVDGNGNKLGYDEEYTLVRKCSVRGTHEVDENKLAPQHEMLVNLGLFPTLTTIYAVMPWSWFVEPLLGLKPILGAASMDMLGVKTYYTGTMDLEVQEFTAVREYKTLTSVYPPKPYVVEGAGSKKVVITRECSSYIDELNPQGRSGPAFAFKALLDSWTDDSWAIAVDPPYTNLLLAGSMLWSGATLEDPKKCTKPWRKGVGGVGMGVINLGLTKFKLPSDC